jgi:hypothetical protein
LQQSQQQSKARGKKGLPVNQKGKALINLQFDSDLQLFQKIEYLSLKNRGKGARKPTFDMGSSAEENVSKTYLKWVIDEYFYSYIDKPYFQFNEFDGILRKAGATNEQF